MRQKSFHHNGQKADFISRVKQYCTVTFQVPICDCLPETFPIIPTSKKHATQSNAAKIVYPKKNKNSIKFGNACDTVAYIRQITNTHTGISKTE